MRAIAFEHGRFKKSRAPYILGVKGEAVVICCCLQAIYPKVTSKKDGAPLVLPKDEKHGAVPGRIEFYHQLTPENRIHETRSFTLLRYVFTIIHQK